MHLPLRLTMIVLAAALAGAAAARPADPATVRELFQELKLQALMESVGQHMRTTFSSQMDAMLAKEPLFANDAEVKALLDEFGVKVMDITFRELTSEAMWDEVVSAYAQVYTQDEIEALLKFYRSPVGRKVVEKTPVLTQQTIALVQRRMPVVQMEIEQLGKELGEKLKALRAKREAEAKPKP